MATFRNPVLSYVWFAFLIAMSDQCAAGTDEERQVHIVYLRSQSKGAELSGVRHYSMLENVLDRSHIGDSLVRSYKRSFNGFAAKLTNQERRKVANMDGVVSIFPSRTLQLHTTRSWDFMGFLEKVKRKANIESDVIVGVLDTGIWPESQSFSDEGFGPPPKKWKGACKGGSNFTCNNKLVGARIYNSISHGNETARDKIGHGTHTASIAAGNHVANASFYDLAKGTARGGVPSARIAVYKVCTDAGCAEEDILAAFDDAISDGVDIITISLGAGNGVDFKHDAISIGAFHAMEKDILTVHSAGNNGPIFASLVSFVPWILTVAASNTDRRIVDKVVLGNGKTILGASINSFTLQGSSFPIVFGKNITIRCDESNAQTCQDECLDGKLVKGKIVLCNTSRGVMEANRVGAVGVIGQRSKAENFAHVVPLPASGFTAKDFGTILSYFKSAKLPRANILKSESTTDNSAPFVSSFSSRGPNLVIPDILKPDISAPGVEILAAFSPAASPSEDSLDKRSVKYSILSGTSMACPHVAGVAAYVKTFHPDWSPSVIKSAIMTTARSMNATEVSGGEFGFGSGHIAPVKALNPGLVYEISAQDYAKTLCELGGFSETMLRLVTGDNTTCANVAQGEASARNLNYPSMAAKVESDVPFKVLFTRTVTNVGLWNSTYKPKVTTSSRLKITVKPGILSFESLNEKKSFVATVAGNGPKFMVSASLTWADGTHSVRSPIVIYTEQSD